MAAQQFIFAEGNNGGWWVGYTYDDVTNVIASADWHCASGHLDLIVHRPGQQDIQIQGITGDGSQPISGNVKKDSKTVRGLTIEVNWSS